jgi:hypothetical protein
VTALAKDAKTGLSGQGVYTVTIASAARGPSITASAMTGVVGKPLSGSIVLADPGASSVSVSIAGVPAGMTFSVSGQTLLANWPSPVQGNYTLLVSMRDNLGLAAQASVSVTVTAK